MNRITQFRSTTLKTIAAALVAAAIVFILYLTVLFEIDPKEFRVVMRDIFGLKEEKIVVPFGNPGGNPPPFGSGDYPGWTPGPTKIGLHVGPGGNQEGLSGWMQTLDAAGIPFFLKSADSAGQLAEAQGYGPEHTLVYRISTAGQNDGYDYDVPNYNLEPAEAAAEHWARTKAKWPPELNPSIVWVESINEVDKNRSDWLGWFSLEEAKLANADGFRYAAFGWSAGEPEPYHWRTAGMEAFLRYAADRPDSVAVALHEYSYDTGAVQGAFPHLIGRFQWLFDATDQMGTARPTVLITEWGWTYENVPDVATAMGHIVWADNLYKAHPQVRGAALWYLGPGFGDISSQAQLLIAPMTEYALGLGVSTSLPADNQMVSFRRSKLVQDEPPAPPASLTDLDYRWLEGEAKANNWINSQGGDIDLGIQVAIMEWRSRNGLQLGDIWVSEVISGTEVLNVEQLLPYWNLHRLRHWSTYAFGQIREDYGDYFGGPNGEIGVDQLKPSEAWRICQELSSDPTEPISSCNFFDPTTAPYAKAWWLWDAGYATDLSPEEKSAILADWIPDEDTRQQILNRAEVINQAIQNPPPPPAGGSDDPPPSPGLEFIVYWTYPVGSLADQIPYLVRLFQALGILPLRVFREDQVPCLVNCGGSGGGSGNIGGLPPGPPPTDGQLITSFVHPHPGARPTQDVHGGNGVIGVDFGYDGTPHPILAMHNGVVLSADWIDYYDDSRSLSWWVVGWTVAIQGYLPDGSEVLTIYGHMSEGTFAVAPGDIVQAGQYLGMSGASGNNPHITGVHLHLGMRLNGIWVDPRSYFGQTFDPPPPVSDPPPGQEWIATTFKVSHYTPWTGGTNCGVWDPVTQTCVSKMANGEPWETNLDIAVACPREWPFGTQVRVLGEQWTCKDRGGAIRITPDGAWIDMLTANPRVPFGTRVDGYILMP